MPTVQVISDASLLVSHSSATRRWKEEDGHEEVLDYCGRHVEISEEVLGKTHPNTLTSVYCRAYLLQNKQEFSYFWQSD